jgi:hypothetical protein
MPPDWLVPALAALVAVAALSMAAATFDSARPDEGFTLGGDDGPPPGANDGPPPERDDDGGAGTSPLFVPEFDFGGGDDGGGTAAGGSLPPAVLAVVVLALAGAAVLAYRLTGDDVRAARPSPDDGGTASPWPADPTLPNAVYRSWYQLARRSPVERHPSATPGEVATAAVDDGLPADAVATVTDEFRRARYADVPVTAAAERRVHRAADRLPDATGATAAVTTGSDRSDPEAGPADSTPGERR